MKKSLILLCCFFIDGAVNATEIQREVHENWTSYTDYKHISSWRAETSSKDGSKLIFRTSSDGSLVATITLKDSRIILEKLNCSVRVDKFPIITGPCEGHSQYLGISVDNYISLHFDNRNFLNTCQKGKELRIKVTSTEKTISGPMEDEYFNYSLNGFSASYDKLNDILNYLKSEENFFDN